MYCAEHPHTQGKCAFPSTVHPPCRLYPSQCSRFYCALHRGRHSAPDIIPQKDQTRAIYREKINLSTNTAHRGLKPVLAPSFSLPISGHQRESSSLGLGRTLRQGQKASSDQPSITDALQTLLIIQQQRGCISFEPSYDLHIKSILTASTLSYLNNNYQKSAILDHSAPSSLLVWASRPPAFRC